MTATVLAVLLIHRLYVDLWGPIWPNLAASAICSGMVYLRLRVHQRRHHEAMKQHVTEQIQAARESGS